MGSEWHEESVRLMERLAKIGSTEGSTDIRSGQPQVIMSNHALAKIVLISAVVSGLAAIFFSTEYLSRFPHGEVIFPWQFPAQAVLTFGATGIFLMVYVLQRPERFWHVLIGTAAMTGGIFVLRFPIFDEWLVGSITVGGMAAAMIGGVPRRRDRSHRLWVMGFLALSLYMAIMSVVGAIVWENPKAVRFLLTFVVVFIVGYLLANYDFPRPAPAEITVLLAGIGLAYYLLYIVHGLVFYSSVKTSILEGIGFASSGYQTAIGIVAVPAAIILICEKRGNRRGLGWTVLIMGLVVTALSDSRGGILAVLGGLLVAPLAFGVKGLLKLVALGVVVSVIIGTVAFDRPQWGLDIGESLVDAFHIESGSHTYEYFGRSVTAAKGDGGRFLYIRAALETILNQNHLFSFTGVGSYGYFPVAGPYFEKVAVEYGINSSTVNYGSSTGDGAEPPRPPAFGAFIVEEGIIGFILLTGCCIATIASSVFRKSRSNTVKVLLGPNLMLLTPLFLAIAWTAFGEIQDMILPYLLVMPFGLIHTWGRLER